jgi:hypothetical protein
MQGGAEALSLWLWLWFLCLSWWLQPLSERHREPHSDKFAFLMLAIFAMLVTSDTEFLLQLFHRSFDSLFESWRGSPIGYFVPAIGIPVVTFFLRWNQHRGEPRMRRLVETARDTAIAAIVLLIPFFLYHLLYEVRPQIYAEADAAKAPMPLSPLPPHDWGRKTNLPNFHPVHLLDIHFTNSPLLTGAVKRRIKQDLTHFRLYLINLRLEIPTSLPPVSVGSPAVLSKPLEVTVPSEAMAFFLRSRGRYEARQYPGQKPSTDFNQNIVLMKADLEDRSAIVALYGMYVISQVLDRIVSDPPDDWFWQAHYLVISEGAVYFASSFCDEKMGYSQINEALWEIRHTLGQPFTDELMAYTLRACNESIYRTVKALPAVYFYNRMKDAAETFDDAKLMKQATRIWLKRGLPVS